MESSSLNPLAPPFFQRLTSPNESGLQPDTIRSTIYSDLSSIAKGNSDDSAIANLADMYAYLYLTIASLETKIEPGKPQGISARLTRLEREIEYINYENSQLKYHLAVIEDATKYMNLRVEGMNENNNNNLVNQAAKVLSKTGVQCHPSDLDYARRIGKFRTGHTRPVLVRFVREGKRNAILYARNNINKNRAPNSRAPLVWINDDISDITRRNRKNVRDIATLAKQQGDESVRVHGDGLVVGEGKYRHKDLDLLPTHLALGKAKTREEAEEIFFQGELSPLSNFYPAQIVTDDSMVFCSVEQAFQFKKATFLGWNLTADKIVKTRDPYEIKRLSNLLPSSDEWKATEYETMVEIVQLKFIQNEDLRQILLSTGDKALHEATNSGYWAIGAELSSKVLENRTWEGSDMLGNLLTDLRQNLLAKFPLSSPPPSDLGANADQSVVDTDMRPMSDDDDGGSVHENDQSHSFSPEQAPTSNSRSGETSLMDDQQLPQPMHAAPASTSTPTPTPSATAPVSAQSKNKQSTQGLPPPSKPGKQADPKRVKPNPKSTNQGSQASAGPIQPGSQSAPKTPSSKQELRTTADYFTPKHSSQTHSIATSSQTGTLCATTIENQRPIRTSQRVGKKNT